MRLFHYIFLQGLLLFNIAGGIHAQDTSLINGANNSADINWIKQFPPAPGDIKAPGGNEKFKDFVFGKKDLPVIQKPMCVIAANPDTFMLADQANGIIFQVENMQYQVPRHLRKKFVNFTSLVAMCTLPGGEILFTDSHLKTVFKITSGKKDLRVLNDSLLLTQPTGIAYNKATGHIWVVETGAHRISILDKNGNLIRTLGQRGNDELEFNFPTFIWIDEAGRVYLVDTMNYRVQILDKNGNFISAFGTVGDATGYFARPKGIATDSHGNIYVADALFHCVQIFDQKGRFLNNFGSQGRNPEEFLMPSGVYIDSKDYIYVADSYNSRVQIFQIIYHDEKKKD